MEAVLDALAAYLAGATTAGPGLQPSDVVWVVGDVGMGVPEGTLPFGFVVPLNDVNEPGLSTSGTHGVDMDRMTVPMVIVQSRHKYVPPVATTVGSGYFEQPGYRDMMRLAQNVRAAVRANITLGGVVATSMISELRYVLIDLDDKVYRACRLTLTIRQRRGR